MVRSDFNGCASYWRNNHVEEKNSSSSFKKYLVIPLFAATLILPSSIHPSSALTFNPKNAVYRLEETLENRVDRTFNRGITKHNLGSKVKARIEKLVGSEDSRKELELILSKLSAYDDYFEQASRETGYDINFIKAYVAQESEGNTHAESHKGAAGLGGLMPVAAREVELTVNHNVDERFDPKAIVASSKYMKKYIDYFKDHVVGLIAYNAGPTWTLDNLSKILGHADIVKNAMIPYESRDYILQVAAKMQIFSDPSRFNINFSKAKPMSSLRVGEYVAGKDVPLNKVAKLHNVKVTDLKMVNPAIRSDFVPKGTKVHIPKGPSI
ncbi:MAG: transglycosylase SLT domain-containing protein [archaeon]